MATLADLLRLEGGAFVGYPQMPNKTVPQPRGGYAEGFLSSATGIPQQPNMSVLNPNEAAYLKGRQAGEPVGIAAMALPLAAPLTVATAKTLAPKAAQMSENYLRKVGGIADVVPIGPNRIPSNEILFPNRTLESLNSAEKSALTKFDKDLGNQAVMRREILRSHFDQLVPQEKRVTKLVDKNILTPQDLLNTQIVGFGGDQLRAGVKLKSIKGVPLSQDVTLQGGDEFAFLKPNYNKNTVWASNEESALGHLTNIDKAFDASGGRPVRAVKVGMNPEGANFSHPIAQALVRQLDVLKPSKADLKLADELIKNQKAYGDMSGFAGLRSPDLERQLLEGTSNISAGDLRKSLIKSISSYELKKRGFPVYEDVLDASLIPNLRNKRTGEAGNLIYEPQYQDQLIANPVYPHGSYTHGIPRQAGGVIGGFEDTIPIEILARKTYNAKIAEGKSRQEALRSMQTGHWSEQFDQESLDAAMKYLQEQTKK